MKICSFIITFLLFFNPIRSYADEKILTTIPAIASIIENITDKPAKVIINDAAVTCAHDYQLKPSDAMAISNAKLIVTIGKGYEPFFDEISKLKNENTILIELATDQKIKLLPLRQDSLWEKHSHTHRHEKEHEHKETEEKSYDYHIWLDPDNALSIAALITDTLSTMFPDKKYFYMGNFKNFSTSITSLKETIPLLSATKKNIKYLISHDSIQYLEKTFKLTGVGAISSLENGELSIKKALEIEKIIKNENVSLLLIEGKNYPKSLDYLKKNYNLKIKNIDVIGTTLPKGKDLYFQLITDIMESIYL